MKILLSALKQQITRSVHRGGGLVAASTPGRGFASAENALVKTACYDLHKEVLGGDMVPFAGYELPVLYKGENGGVMKEHLWCRADGKAAMFDVSHMGQVGQSNNDDNPPQMEGANDQGQRPP
jgi:Aminomethyltransferase folate-binding domain